MRRVVIFVASFLCIAISVFPQAVKPVAPKTDVNADEGRLAIQAIKDAQTKRKQAVDLVHEWFRRWNALDGKADSLNKFLELYRPDAMQEVGPNERQSGGAVLYQGQKLIRKLAEDFSKQWTVVNYLIANRTVKEKTVELIQTGETPWGATEVAVEFTGGQMNSQTKKRFMLRGAAFFEFQDGKIIRVRVYIPKDEMLEITGPLSVTM